MIRLMLTQLIRTLERRPDMQSQQGRKTNPILVLLDEFPLLGKMDAITNALTTLRSKKVTFCLMVQSIAQMDVVYGQDIRKIIVDNCQYKAMLNITEPDSQEYFSRLIGTVPIGRRSISHNYDPTTEHSSWGGGAADSRISGAVDSSARICDQQGYLAAYAIWVAKYNQAPCGSNPFTCH